jgi:hypothetical protein
MTRYIKIKAVVVEAWQITDLDSEHTQKLPPSWVFSAIVDKKIQPSDRTPKVLVVETAHGAAFAEIGDWIIKEDEDLYPCTDEKFKQLFGKEG